MKKFFTLLVATFFTLSLVAQVNQSSEIKEFKKKQNFKTHEKGVFFSEDFEGGQMPDGWTEELGNAIQGWTFNSDASSDFFEIPPHTIYACINDDACNCDMSNVLLITNVIDLSDKNGVILDFDFVAPTWTDDICGVKVSTDGGTTWSLFSALPQTDEWEHIQLNLSSYSGESNFKLAFYYSDNNANDDDYGFAIDDIVLTEPEFDFSVVSIYPEILLSGNSVNPEVVIENLSGVNEKFDQITLSDGQSYNETIEGTNLIPYLSQAVVTFPAWSPQDGNHTLTATLEVEGDENMSNNTLSITCEVKKLIYPEDAYCLNAHQNKFGSLDLETGAFSPIADVMVEDDPFPMGAEYNGDAIYQVFHNGTMGIVLPETGECINIKPITGLDSDVEPTGLAWDWNKKIMYMSASNSSKVTHFGIINLNNYEFTEISTQSSCLLIAIDMAKDGFIYGPALNDDKLYRIDPVTGAFNPVGATGYNINYGQDVSCDPETGVFYSPSAIESGELNWVNYNLETGHMNIIAPMEYAMVTFAITKKDETIDIKTVNSNEFNIFPNPTDGIFNIDAKGKYDISIVDVTGKIIYCSQMTDYKTIDISEFQKGIYFVELKNQNEISNFKIIKK